MDWSIRADNFQGTDLVVRLVQDGEASYFLLPNESDALIAAGKGSPPGSPSVTTLDPVSCRPIGEVTDLPGEHTRVGVSWGGTIDSGTYDPRDIGDDWGLSDRLARTDTCSDSDPSATPAPPPSLLVGDWPNGWEISCETIGDASAFGVRGEFLNGAVAGCEAEGGLADDSIPEDDVAVWNPDDDPTKLAVSWRDARCVNGATVSLLPRADHYVASVISIADGCPDSAGVYRAVFYLTEPIDAGRVATELDLVADP